MLRGLVSRLAVWRFRGKGRFVITFAVSDVERATEALQGQVSVEGALVAKVRRRLEAVGGNAARLVESQGHGFLAAVGMAFDRHYPLVLSPDDVWLCLAQGLATHVRLHAEELRSRLVSHQGKKEIVVERHGFVRGARSNDWPGVFAELSEKIRELVGKKRDLVVADFSTTGAVERAASEVVLFDALQWYLEYRVDTLCGIPEVTLLGTPEDWVSIRRRAEAFAELDLEAWTKALLPVLDKLVETARGRVDTRFWQSLLKVRSRSGGPFVTGWINVLFPYVDVWDPVTHQVGPGWNRDVTRWKAGLEAEYGGGPSWTYMPTGLSSAPFVWNYLGTEIPMTFTSGFAGVAQDPESLALRPAIGWAISEQ